MSFISSPSSIAGWIIFVRKTGNDTTGDGTSRYPFATVNKALSVITDNAATKYYKIDVGPGRYDETSIAIKPFVWIVGCGQQIGGPCRINVTGGGSLVTADTSFNSHTQGARGGISNVYFRGSTGLNFDLTATGGSFDTILELNNVTFNGNVVYKGKSNGDGLDWRNGETFGDVSLYGAGSNAFQSVLCFGNLNILSGTGIVQGFDMFNGVVGGDVTMTSTVATSHLAQFVGSNIAGNMVLTQTSGTLTMMVDADSFANGTTTVNSGTLTRTTTAKASAFTPTTGANWNTSPATIQAALDELASRVKALNG
jgi:hypothetical protein